MGKRKKKNFFLPPHFFYSLSLSYTKKTALFFLLENESVSDCYFPVYNLHYYYYYHLYLLYDCWLCRKSITSSRRFLILKIRFNFFSCEKERLALTQQERTPFLGDLYKKKKNFFHGNSNIKKIPTTAKFKLLSRNRQRKYKITTLHIFIYKTSCDNLNSECDPAKIRFFFFWGFHLLQKYTKEIYKYTNKKEIKSDFADLHKEEGERERGRRGREKVKE